MQTASHHAANSPSLGNHIACLAQLALDLTREPPHNGAESEAVARPRAYPSPPMSAPPPSPPISQPDDGDASRAQEDSRPAGQKQHQSGIYAQNNHQPVTTTALLESTSRMATVAPPPGPFSASLPPLQYSHENRHHHPPPPPPARPFSDAPQAQLMGPQHHFHGYSDEQDTRSPSSYALPPLTPSHADRGMFAPQYGPSIPIASAPHGYSMAARNPIDPSSLRARKTKGHVASACIPCKKAHLRCDEQRPCTRCTGNGKEDACIDMKHKKRGRPRLRENATDRQRYSLPPDDLIRPLSGYTTTGSVSSVTGAETGAMARYEDPRRQYRVLKSQVGDSNRYMDHHQMSDTNMMSSPVGGGMRALPEAVAYLSMRLEILKASPTFCDALVPGGAGAGVMGHSLDKLVVLSEREKALAMQRRMEDDKARKEPNFLPPIYSNEQTDRVMQSLGFGIEDLSQFQLDYDDSLSFSLHPDAPPRTIKVRFGLAKRESTFFVVLLLIPSAPPQPQPYSRPAYASSPHPELPYYPHQGPHSQLRLQQPLPPPPPPHQHHPHPYSQRAGPPFEMQRPPHPREGPPPPASGYGPPFGSQAPSYSPSPSRLDYPGGHSSHQIPRSELPTALPPAQPLVQLPPIRSQQPPAEAFVEKRPSRVDISSLIKNPDPSR